MGQFNTIWTAIKSKLAADASTTTLKIYAGEDPAKPTLPAVIGFPRKKRWVVETNRDRRRKIPRKVWYEFDIVVAVSAKSGREAILFGTGSIEDWAEKVENVFQADGTLGGVVYGLEWSEIAFEFRPGWLAIAAFRIACRLKETE